MNNKNEISVLIRMLRQRTGLTQEKLAARLGVTFPTINRWEHGRTRPSPLAVLRIKELIDFLGNGGMNFSEGLESSQWADEDKRRLPRYRQRIIFYDSWPVLEQGTD